MTAKTFLEAVKDILGNMYQAPIQTFRDQQSERADTMDRLEKLSKFYSLPFFQKEGISDVFDNYDVNLKIHPYILGNEPIPEQSIDDTIRIYQRAGKKLTWKKEIIEKYFA